MGYPLLHLHYFLAFSVLGLVRRSEKTILMQKLVRIVSHALAILRLCVKFPMPCGCIAITLKPKRLQFTYDLKFIQVTKL